MGKFLQNHTANHPGRISAGFRGRLPAILLLLLLVIIIGSGCATQHKYKRHREMPCPCEENLRR